MILKQIVDELDVTPVHVPENWEEIQVGSVFASDLISDILVSEGEEQLLLTSLTTPQVVRTAAIVGAAAIIIVHRKQIPSGLAGSARVEEIPLFYSSIPKYDACVRLGKMEDAP
ncbi:MAG: hypothetical protein JXR23_06725 [Pontiellaceae bacterium]|nr:hypothetical protein [Pontiellaceae bacterium]